MEGFCRNLAQALLKHHANFIKALSGIDSPPVRRWFAHIVMGRLLLIYDLQVAGFLAQGDRWYLHNQLSFSTTQQPDTFFKGFLQPLCHQGLGLPELERPQALQMRIGNVPYLGSQLFQVHSLEQHYPQLDLPDEPLEQFLGWLAEYPWQRTYGSLDKSSPVISRWTLAAAYEYIITVQTGKATISTVKALEGICRTTVDAHLLQLLHQHIDGNEEISSVTTLLTHMNTPICERLVKKGLPEITVLDPACGSGRFLLMALERLQAVYLACCHYAQTSSSPVLQAWRRSLPSDHSVLQRTLTEQILTQTLYGVDRLPEAVTITQVQLWLRLLSTAQVQDDLAPLPDLDFNITQGNALMGFVRVDEASFDKIVPKRSSPSQPTETVLQGNLLQPLAAANYRDTLTEKKIRVEHYQTQIKAMGCEGGIPEYAQMAFLRDRIEVINQAAQQKLDRLLFETCSRKLSIQIQEPYTSGKSRRRLLTPKDVQALQPLHWGFFFNAVIEQHGGFDVILTHAPEGTLSPNTGEFYRQYETLFQTHNIERTIFRRSRRQILQQFPDLSRLWGLYAGRIAVLKDYVRRSDDYQLPLKTAALRSISLKLLFLQRCKALAKEGGVPPYVH